MSKENIIQNIFTITKELNDNMKQLDLSECPNEIKEDLLHSLNEMLKTLTELSPQLENNIFIAETEKMLNENILSFKKNNV